jgi:hypothetical protein
VLAGGEVGLISVSALGCWQSVRGSCLGFSIPCGAVRRPERSGSLPRRGGAGVARRARTAAGGTGRARWRSGSCGRRRFGGVLAGAFGDVGVELVPGVGGSPGGLGGFDSASSGPMRASSSSITSSAKQQAGRPLTRTAASRELRKHAGGAVSGAPDGAAARMGIRHSWLPPLAADGPSVAITRLYKCWVRLSRREVFATLWP